MSETNGAVPTCGFTGHKFSYCDCEVPTPLATDHDLLAKYTPLEACENIMSNHHEIEGQNYLGDPTRECAECGSYFPCDVYRFANALRAVLEIPQCDFPYGEMDVTQKYFKSGYNQCLADVKAAIVKELG